MNVLYIMSSYNIFGGTPKKTLDLMRHFGGRSSLYVYSEGYSQFRKLFEETGGKIVEGYYGKNVYRHLRALVSLIDERNIQIIQSQFSMGEFLLSMLKRLRPNVKIIVAFVGANSPNRIKKSLLAATYKNVDAFVYISEYVRREKEKQYHVLPKHSSHVFYNGTQRRLECGDTVPLVGDFRLLTVGGITRIKNIGLLLEVMSILVHQMGRSEISLYVVGDGPERTTLESIIVSMLLQNNVFFIGYHTNVGFFLSQSTIYLHPCYCEGFGIAVAEAMMAEKPVIVANAGALPELIENEVSGLVVDAHEPEQWAKAIMRLIGSPELSGNLARAAKERAQDMFSVEQFVTNYEKLYISLLAKNQKGSTNS